MTELLFFVLTRMATALGVYMLAWWLVSLVLKRNDVADIAWGPAIALTPILLFIPARSDASLVTSFIALAVSIWSMRLAWHILVRFVKKGEEDARYTKMRNDWQGPQWLNSLFRVFLLQGVLAMFISITPSLGILYPAIDSLLWFTYLGFAIWAIGFFFEAVGDWQLSRFIKNPKNKGKIMDQGLWRYTRHPNYFGEVSLWWGVWIMVMSIDVQLWWTIISPLTITFLILKVSGIPMLEARWEGNKQFEAYKKKTSAFFPLPPRK